MISPEERPVTAPDKTAPTAPASDREPSRGGRPERRSDPTRRKLETSDFLALVRQRERGKLKVYIGSAAGTGKTFRMLGEAHDLRRRGIDVVVGFIETHGRVDTEAQIGDL